ncbi:spondin domain-containing protein [uncultured Microbulbifer sp.]|uniref:spondin domain-containing protein n=1 Tax=uncultured Microbulbifer sp. TaxID=348147 RepID=UPI002612E8F3|nr:spondin domain-containing protein [uncultured Microbulbifer sp.]
MKRLKLGALLVSLTISALLTGCDSDNNNRADVPDNPAPAPAPAPEPEPVTVGFEVTVTNLTHGQPLSPVAVVAHDGTLRGWTVGQPSSNGLELLAEGGDNSEFVMAFEDAGSFASVSAEAPLGPGGTESLSLSFAEEEGVLLTVATMLVNTNDAFSGVTRVDVSTLAVGESLQRLAPIYDAGTEFNSELAGTIPGPADGGEGFNAEREDMNFVARHPGIVSRADGYAESVLDQSHRFDQPAMLLSITRTE